MTTRTHQTAPDTAGISPVERAVVTTLVVGALAGAAWLGSMIWTIVSWAVA
ncbi:morphogenic membrane protein MmpA [Streptomyces sannanensis]|uniref:morphogenic membrane protein MmpA n=1 Tax=Streptomyces sannanensis TaxID=285536 RepID=UPI0031EABE80